MKLCLFKKFFYKAMSKKELMKEALFYKKTGSNKVKCGLCHQNCTINDKAYGFCLARINEKGILYSEVYGKLSAVNIDPIEKKPLYHFYPGTTAFSIGTCGCNFKCSFCQNYEISQTSTKNYPYIAEMTPEQVVKQAIKNKCKSIAYTYNEPTINYEFAIETAELAQKKGLKNVFVTNGYIKKKPLKKISHCLDAANIDLKSSSPEFYKKKLKADLKKVFKTIKLYHELKIHTELTTLIIPGENDAKKDIEKLCDWIVDNLGRNVPMHFSRFRQCYKMNNKKPTPADKILMAVQTAKDKGIKFVYAGNISLDGLENTYCPKCGNTAIVRKNYCTIMPGLRGGSCRECGEKILQYY